MQRMELQRPRRDVELVALYGGGKILNPQNSDHQGNSVSKSLKNIKVGLKRKTIAGTALIMANTDATERLIKKNWLNTENRSEVKKKS